MLKKIIPIVIAISAAYFALDYERSDIADNASSELAISQNTVEQLFINRSSDAQVKESGTVIRLLADDLKGSRHQKFIVQTASGPTVLVSHNIDLAPRIDALRKGDRVTFFGEYEWNSKGGVIHWTHHDPAGRHADGWIRHQGLLYQ